MLFDNSKKKSPLPAKTKEEMPHTKIGKNYKEWHDSHKNRHKWRNIRWTVLIGLNLLFFLSFALGLGVLEGSLSGSRFFGIYLMDTFNALQVLGISTFTGRLVFLTMNFWIGFSIIIFLAVMGGRTYCSWICPYHFIAELLEKLHNSLVKKKKIKEHTFNTGIRYIFWIGFLILAVFTQQLVFENINPVGIISRAIIYGPGLILLWVLALMIFEVVYSKRFWCRYVCPVGTTFKTIGEVATPLTIKFDLEKCAYCADCQKVCLVPHELWFVKKGKATQEVHFTGSDCTNCGLCVDVCAGEALTYTIRGIDKLL